MNDFGLEPEQMQRQITDLRAEIEVYRVEELSRKMLAHNLARECESVLLRYLPPDEKHDVKDYSEEADGVTSLCHLIWMCRMVASRQDWTSTRMHRWIGFIQGVMSKRGWADLEALKDMVRRCRQSHEETDIPGTSDAHD